MYNQCQTHTIETNKPKYVRLIDLRSGIFCANLSFLRFFFQDMLLVRGQTSNTRTTKLRTSPVIHPNNIVLSVRRLTIGLSFRLLFDLSIHSTCRICIHSTGACHIDCKNDCKNFALWQVT